jgi:hypothetical protein
MRMAYSAPGALNRARHIRGINVPLRFSGERLSIPGRAVMPRERTGLFGRDPASVVLKHIAARQYHAVRHLQADFVTQVVAPITMPAAAGNGQARTISGTMVGRRAPSLGWSGWATIGLWISRIGERGRISGGDHADHPPSYCTPTIPYCASHTPIHALPAGVQQVSTRWRRCQRPRTTQRSEGLTTSREECWNGCPIARKDRSCNDVYVGLQGT